MNSLLKWVRVVLAIKLCIISKISSMADNV